MRHRRTQRAELQAHPTHESNGYTTGLSMPLRNHQFGHVTVWIGHHQSTFNPGFPTEGFSQQRTALPADDPDFFLVRRRCNPNGMHANGSSIAAVPLDASADRLGAIVLITLFFNQCRSEANVDLALHPRTLVVLDIDGACQTDEFGVEFLL